MYINIFPRTFSGLLRQHYAQHHVETAMLPLVSLDEYLVKLADTTAERVPLSGRELAQARSYQVPKRQKEWLTGRLCVKMAAMRYLKSVDTEAADIRPSDIHIENHDAGRPFLAGQTAERFSGADISLSHGGGYGAALIADTNCGIDIQEGRETLKRVRGKFCTVEEEEILGQNMADLSELQHLTLLWTAKEAVKKGLSRERMPGFLELFLSEIEPHISGWVLSFVVSARNFSGYPPSVTAAADLYDGFGIAACLTESDTDA